MDGPGAVCGVQQVAGELVPAGKDEGYWREGGVSDAEREAGAGV